MSTTTIITPAHIDAPDGIDVGTMTLADIEAMGSEKAETDALARINYYLAVSALTVYRRSSGGESGESIAADLHADPITGKARGRQYVSRLALIGEAVSHGVTDARAFRTAMRGKRVPDVRTAINEYVTDDGIDEDGLIAALTAEPKPEKAERTEQEAFHNRIKSAAQTFGAAVAQFGAEDTDVVITDDIRAMLAVIAEGLNTLA